MLGIRRLLRLVGVLFFIPCLSGAIGGILLSYYNHTTLREDLWHFQHETSRARWMDGFSVPGNSIHDTNLPPFYVPHLRTHNWLSKLDFRKRPADLNGPTSMFEVASFDDIYVLEPQLRPHWIYLSFLPAPDVDPWDKAFDAVVQYHAHIPPAHNASLNFVRCVSSQLLCKLWDVTPPALLHVNPLPDRCHPDPYVAFTRASVQLGSNVVCPVEARVIHLPLQNSSTSGSFPSYFQQILSLTGDDSFHSAFPVFDFIETQNNRWLAYLDRLTSGLIPLQVLFRCSDVFKAAPSFLGPVFDTAETVASFVSQLLSGLIYTLIRSLFDQIVAMLRGFVQSPPWKSSPPSPSQLAPNLMEPVISSFVEALKKNMSREDHSKMMDLLKNFTANSTPSGT